ncbi:Sodium/calcium exchanger protein-domain-containing protein [Lineolata rhizophorae]|uniref:Vacuolar calcium ion transporter n=1 Tax=Lineolata rhizophorae TaxID=578093 RepID=A0A6A6P4Z6_9PEZI|nr:Sodium/calcium exchanger protein-domain-containing protein [Lineolata rhizophorae]
MESAERNKIEFTLWGQVKTILLGSWINLLLVAVPAGFACEYAHVEPVATFVVNFAAIVPLAGILAYATEEIALRVGETLGGLLNATFGNAVELIVSIIALVDGEIIIVQSSLIGSMLSNLLLVLGLSFFLGGINREEQNFNVVVAQTSASLLALCIGSLIVPTAFHLGSAPPGTEQNFDGVAEISRGSSIVMLLVYASYLIFQLKSHREIYNKPSEKTPKRSDMKRVETGEVSKGIARMGIGPGAAVAGSQYVDQSKVSVSGDDEDEQETPQISVWAAIITLVAATVLVAFCAEFLVGSVDAVTSGSGISRTFLGLILLPIVGNAAEHATAVTVAIKDKMDLSIGVAVGSSMQIALLVLPFTVILGWIIGEDRMTLYFDGFQIGVLFVAVLLVNYLIQDGKSHWLEGVLLVAMYIIIAIAAYFYPTIENTAVGGSTE